MRPACPTPASPCVPQAPAPCLPALAQCLEGFLPPDTITLLEAIRSLVAQDGGLGGVQHRLLIQELLLIAKDLMVGRGGGYLIVGGEGGRGWGGGGVISLMVGRGFSAHYVYCQAYRQVPDPGLHAVGSAIFSSSDTTLKPFTALRARCRIGSTQTLGIWLRAWQRS